MTSSISMTCAITPSARSDDVMLGRDALLALVDALHSAVFVFETGSGVCHYANPAAEHILGLEGHGSALNIDDIASRILAADRDHLEGWNRPSHDGAVRSTTFRIHHPQLGLRWISWRCQPLPRLGRIELMHCVAEDVSAAKEQQHALDRAKEQAQSAIRAKAQFLANMSHEIRTPMNGVLGMTELLLGTDLDARQRRFAQIVYDSGEALLEVITDILDYSKIEAGRIELQEDVVSLPSLIEDVVELMGPKAHQKDLELVYDVDPALPRWVRADAGRLRQILVNLVSNAVKFTVSGEISIRADLAHASEAHHSGAAWVRFAVTDTGVGMRPEMQWRLFRAFSPGDDARSKRFGGTGLGLIISSALANMMGGRIRVRSREGRGSTFFCKIPVVAVQGPQDDDVSLGAATSLAVAGRHVLIVDDNPTNRDILVHQLRRWGVDCEAAESGEVALDMLHEAIQAGQPYEAALIDMKMPGMSGVELVEIMQQSTTLASTKRIMLTSISAPGEIARARAAGVMVWLEKPVRETELRQTLATLFKKPSGALAVPQGCLQGSILLVEDNPVNREIALAMLGHTDCQVTQAESGRQAIALLAEHKPDLILMDCHMPDMDGFETIRLIREGDRTIEPLAVSRDIPVIALTASALSGDRENCLTAGFDDYLAKPFSEEELVDVLRRWLPASNTCNSQPAIEGINAQSVVDPALGSPASPSASNSILDPKVISSLRSLERNGSWGLVERLSRTFLDSAPELVSKMRRAFDIGDMAAARNAAHTLKSCHANLGASEMSRLCARMELYAQTGNPGAALRSLVDAESEFDRVLFAITDLNASSMELP